MGLAIVGISTWILFLASSAQAEFAIKDEEISLVGGSCDQLIAQRQALAQWKVRLGENPPIAEAMCDCIDRHCTLNVSDVVPVTASQLLGSDNKAWGPNCYQAVLNAGAIVPGVPRFASSEELSYWLTSPVCRPKSKDEAPDPGDIGLVSCVSSEIPRKSNFLHAFIFLSKDLVFEKASREPEDRYVLRELGESLKKVRGYAYCQETPGPAGKLELQYFSCQSLSRFLKEHKIKPADNYRATLHKVAEVECRFNEELPWRSSDTSVWRGPLVTGQIKALAQSVEALELYVQREAKESGKNMDDILLWEGLEARLQAMHYVLTVNLQ